MTSYTKLTFASLKDLLAARGLPTTGTKAQLIARLKTQDRETEATEKAMADAIKAASVASPPGHENTYGGKGADRDAAKKGNKAKKGRVRSGTGGASDMKRKERDELSARMRFVRRLQARRAEMEAEMEDEVRRLMVGGEVSEGDGKGGGKDEERYCWRDGTLTLLYRDRGQFDAGGTCEGSCQRKVRGCETGGRRVRERGKASREREGDREEVLCFAASTCGRHPCCCWRARAVVRQGRRAAEVDRRLVGKCLSVRDRNGMNLPEQRHCASLIR